jgi:hypothetical protein
VQLPTIQGYFINRWAQWSDTPVRVGIQELFVKGEIIVHEGIYKLEFAGPAGSGLGVIVLVDGRVVGTDGSVDYDGAYAITGFGRVQASIRAVRPVRTSILSRGKGPSRRRLM